MSSIFTKKKMSDEERLQRKLGDWEQHVNPNIGKPYFFNKKTGETRWSRPEEILFWLPEELESKFTHREIERFREDFAAFDLDGGGTIDEDELSKCFKEMNVEIPGKKLRKMIATFDTDGSGEIEFDEFVALIDKLRRGKGGFGIGDIFSGSSSRLKKKKKGKKKGGKVLPSGLADDGPASGEGPGSPGSSRKGARQRRIFPPLHDWLVDHNLVKYEQILIMAGFRETKTLLLAKEDDFDKMGFKTGHKRKVMAAVKRLTNVGAVDSEGKKERRKRKRKAASKYLALEV